MTGFWLTVLVLRSRQALASHRLTNAFFEPAGGFRTLPEGAALTTVYKLVAVPRRPNLRPGSVSNSAPHLAAFEDGQTHLAARNVQASSRFRTGRSITCSGSGTVEESATCVGHTHNLPEEVPANYPKADQLVPFARQNDLS